MRDEVLEELVKLRKFKPFDFMKSRTLTPELMDIITTLCKEYVAGSEEDRAKMRSLVTSETSFLFLMFSRQLAEMAVQYNSEEYLKQSLIALLIENCKFDARDTMVSMSEVFHSAQKIGMRGNEFFLSMTSISGTEMSEQLRSFALRDPANQNIRSFGFREGKNQDAKFAYVGDGSGW